MMKLIIVSALVVGVTALLAFRFSGAVAGTERQAVIAHPPLSIASGPMKRDDFWALVDHSAVLEADPDGQLADLRSSLLALTPDQILDFERHFDQVMLDSYDWNLWGAAYVANGGASDDGFEYFRCWLISKGRRDFESVAANPDSLADMLAQGESGGDLEFEEFAYVAREAWAIKTGRDSNEMPVIANMLPIGDPKGTPFSEDADALAKRYPKLWARFGS